jgi:GTP-binding protein Era
MNETNEQTGEPVLPMGSPPQPGAETRAGLIALVGRPNVGKSTLLNALIGQKLSIVTSREQTTRERVLGLLTEGDVQMVFVDTPGLLEPRYLLHSSMVSEAVVALTEADVVLLILDPTRDDPPVPDEATLARLRSRGTALHVVINKVDLARPEDIGRLVVWAQEHLDREPRGISAATGAGIEALREELTNSLPRSPFLYPADDLAAQPVRFFVAELIRETLFEEYSQEVPYSSVVTIEEYREAEDPVFIRAQIYVERPSQKGIIIGKGGRAIKRLGQRAREKIEAFIGSRVYLDLWVKPLPGWRKSATELRRLGYKVPDDVT